MKRTKQEIEIHVLSEILRIMSTNGCEDKDDFASNLSEIYVDSISSQDRDSEFLKNALRIRTNFFKVNKIKKLTFLIMIVKILSKKSIKAPFDSGIDLPLSFLDIFPQITKIKQVSNIEKKLNMAESIIQNALRDAFREKGSSRMINRGKDSSLEVADLEHFNLKIKEKNHSFTAVVKGYNSISGKKLSWEDVSHQIMKANRTRPDYILLVTAKEPKDSVISEIQTYCNDVNKPNLVVFVTPLELAKFLIWRKILRS